MSCSDTELEKAPDRYGPGLFHARKYLVLLELGFSEGEQKPPAKLIENSLYEFPYYGSSLKESSTTRKDRKCDR
jgi:hypothetical protein